jgi:hypothetical protein
MIPTRLPEALRASASGIYTTEAAVGLLIAHAHWLDRPDFTRFITITTTATARTATIDWPTAITALDVGDLPCAAGERRMLRLAASLADQTAVHLGDTITGLDHPNTQILIKAIRHVAGDCQFPATRF